MNKAYGDSLVLRCASCSANAPNHACAFSGKGTIGFLLNKGCLIFFPCKPFPKEKCKREESLEVEAFVVITVQHNCVIKITHAPLVVTCDSTGEVQVDFFRLGKYDTPF